MKIRCIFPYYWCQYMIQAYLPSRDTVSMRFAFTITLPSSYTVHTSSSSPGVNDAQCFHDSDNNSEDTTMTEHNMNSKGTAALLTHCNNGSGNSLMPHLMPQSHYLNQFWLIINRFLWKHVNAFFEDFFIVKHIVIGFQHYIPFYLGLMS